MKTNENQKSTNHQPSVQKPFFGATPDHTFFSAERAASPAFFQPKTISPSAIQAKSANSEADGITQPLQRMPAFESEITRNGGVQRKLMNSSASPIQAKLTIGEPGDKYEQEADRVASQVVEQINAPVSAQSTQGESLQRQEEPEEELQAKPEITTLQRMEEKPEELQAKSTLQRQEAIAGGKASTDLTSAINSARGGGQSLDAGLQRSMGEAMGADFSGVRVHTDTQADQLNQSIQAKAFTTGQDVFFRQGAYEPESRGGQELIAHELTHVVQQGQGSFSQINPKLQKHTYIQRGGDGDKDKDTRGTTIGNLCRKGINEIANFFGGINARKHDYETEKINLGNSEQLGGLPNVYQKLSNGPIYLTVPGAVKGKDDEIFGQREEGGTACAFMGGPVTTLNANEDYSLINEVKKGHLFGGQIKQKFWEENGQIFTQVRGQGYGNFAKINEICGPSIFLVLINYQKKYLDNQNSNRKY